MTRLNQLAVEIHETAVEKGWHDRPRPIPEHLALIHSEVSEVLEEYRKPDFCPESMGSELADIIIRTLDLACVFSIDMDLAVRVKMDYNKTRSYRHGDKRC